MDFNKIKEMGLEYAEKGRNAAMDLAERGRTQAKIVSEQTKLARAQRQLGALVYSLAKGNEENQPLVDKYIEMISSIEADLNALKESLGPAAEVITHDLDEEPEDFVVTGPNMLTALPQTVSLSYSEIAYALEKSLTKIDAALMKVLESMPPELYADIVKNGIYLAGGGALIKGLDRRLNEKTGIPFHIAEDPLRAIARGTGIALKNINRFSFLMK